jgi:hypothetical protein
VGSQCTFSACKNQLTSDSILPHSAETVSVPGYRGTSARTRTNGWYFSHRSGCRDDYVEFDRRCTDVPHMDSKQARWTAVTISCFTVISTAGGFLSSSRATSLGASLYRQMPIGYFRSCLGEQSVISRLKRVDPLHSAFRGCACMRPAPLATYLLAQRPGQRLAEGRA